MNGRSIVRKLPTPHEADLAQRRYLHVDPANRLVADSLEADWNNKLRALNAAQEQYEQQRQNDRSAMAARIDSSPARKPGSLNWAETVWGVATRHNRTTPSAAAVANTSPS